MARPNAAFTQRFGEIRAMLLPLCSIKIVSMLHSVVPLPPLTFLVSNVSAMIPNGMGTLLAAATDRPFPSGKVGAVSLCQIKYLLAGLLQCCKTVQ